MIRERIISPHLTASPRWRTFPSPSLCSLCQLRYAATTSETPPTLALYTPTAALYKTEQVFGFKFRIRLENHHRFDRLAPLRIGHADDGGFQDGRMTVNNAFDFQRINTDTAALHHVFLAARRRRETLPRRNIQDRRCKTSRRETMRWSLRDFCNSRAPQAGFGK